MTHLSSCPKTIKINARRSAQSDTLTHTQAPSYSLSLSLSHTLWLSFSLLPLLHPLSLSLPPPLQFVQAAVVVVVIKNPFRSYIMTGTPPNAPPNAFALVHTLAGHINYFMILFGTCATNKIVRVHRSVEGYGNRSRCRQLAASKIESSLATTTTTIEIWPSERSALTTLMAHLNIL